MIRRLKIENFCSILGKETLDLTTSSKTPTNNSFVDSTCGDQVSLLAGVFGANAAGKTNAIKSLAFLDYFLNFSYRNPLEDGCIPIDGFGGTEHPSFLSLEFEHHNKVFRYETEVGQNTIFMERLLKQNKKTNSFRTLLHRKKGARGPLLKQEDGFTDLAALKALLKDRPDASMIAAGFVTGRKEFLQLRTSLGLTGTNVKRIGKLESLQNPSVDGLIQCARYLQKNPHFEKEVEYHLQKADLGISQFVIKEIEMASNGTDGTEKVPYPFVLHATPHGPLEMPMGRESSGTKRLLMLLTSILPALTTGGLALIDEIESDLHPHLIPMILDLFIEKETNPKRAQLIFTCHHVEVLNHLAKEQIYLVEKDQQNVSSITRLSKVRGVLRGENHFANYNAGRYGAIPEPELF